MSYVKWLLESVRDSYKVCCTNDDICKYCIERIEESYDDKN